MLNTRKKLLPLSLDCRTAVVSVLIALFSLLLPAYRLDAFSVRDFAPVGQISGPATVRIVFDSDMVKSGDVGRVLESEELPVNISPKLNGAGRWLDERIFTYQPSNGYFAEATEYILTLKETLEDTEGLSAQNEAEYRFSTPPLEFRGARQINFHTEHNFIEYQLLFSIPVSPSRLDGFISFTDEMGERVRFDYLTTQPSASIPVRLDAGDGTPITLRLEKGLTSVRGPLGLSDTVSLKVERDLSLKIRDSSARSDYSGAYIYIETTGPVDAERAKSFVELTPEAAFSLDSYEGSLRIRGDFKPRDRVSLRLKKGLPVLRGAGLGEDWTRSFIFPDADPSIAFASQGRFISPANEELMLPIVSVNIEKIDVIVRRVYDNNVSVVTRGGWPYYVSDMAEEFFKKTYQISSELNEKTRSTIDLKAILDGRKGLFEVYAGKANDWPNATRVINVTDIAGSAKIYDRGALVWANSIKEGTPLSEASVTLYSSSHQILAEGMTDKDGLWHYVGNSAWQPNLRPDLIVLKKGDDVSVLRLDGSIWHRGDADLAGLPYSSGGEYVGICYAPRGVFRPGESVPIQVLVREKNLAASKPFPVQLKVRTPLGREWKRATLNLSDMGMASELLKLSDSSPTGAWEASVHLPGEESPIARMQFLVEDFAPPRIKVEVSSDKRSIMPEEEAKLFVFSEYLFGAPADSLSYEAELTIIPREYSHPDWKGYRFSDERIATTSSTSDIAKGNLSPAGTAEIPLSAPSARAFSVLDLAVRVGVMEDGGRWVYKSLTVPYYPRKVMLGILPPNETVTTGAPTPFAFASINADGERLGTAAVAATLYKQRTRSIISTEGYRRRAELRKEYLPVAGYEGIPVAMDTDISKMDITFETGGYYLLALESEEADASAAISFYVYDGGWSYGEEATLPESLNIVADKPRYELGDKATVRVRGSFEGTLLLTAETDEVLLSQVGKTADGEAEFTFEITENMIPNAWLTAHLVRPALPEESWASHRAFGALPLEVDCSYMALSLDITPPERLKTWTVNQFALQLRDSQGNGAKGEVALMLVDEGVLSLTNFKTPDFLAYYMSRRGLSIEAYDIYSELMPLYLENPNVLTPGGGAMEDAAMGAMTGASLSPVKANRFKVLTLWKRVKTDDDGNAVFSFTLPEFTGRAKLMALAASERAFGSAEKSFEVARDVVPELSLPRAMAPEDVVESSVQLFNKSGKNIDVDIELKIDGPLYIVDDIASSPTGIQAMKRTISLPSSDSAHSLPLYLKAGALSGLAKLTLTARFPGDAVMSTVELPVRPPYPRISKSGSYSVPPGESREINIPSDWFIGTRRAHLLVSGISRIELADAARFLISYPYHCLEQTVSSGWALLAQPDLVASLEPELATREQLLSAMAERIRRIQSLQMYHGGFSPWPKSEESKWSSVYATHFLLACEEKGIAVPRDTLNAAISYLEQLVAIPPGAESDEQYGAELALRAYICYVLSMKGEQPLAWMSYIRESISSMPSYGRILLAAAYGRAGERDLARSLLGENVPSVLSYEPEKTERFNFDSPIRDQSLYLMAWNEVDPTGASAVASAAELLDSLRMASRCTTQEAGFAMPALADFFALNAGEGDPELQIEQGNIVIAEVSGDTICDLQINKENNNFVIKNTGKTTGYASWAADGVPIVRPEAEDIGIKVRVEYRDSSGVLLGRNAEVARGERVRGKILLSPLAGASSNIIVSLPLAGGMEIENPNLMDSPQEDYGYTPYSTSRAELRDDRLLLFVDSLDKEFEWEFSMRAVSPGRFTLPPVTAEGMYSPGTRSISEPGRITISK